MVGDILKWAEPLLRDFFKNDSDNQQELIQRIFGLYNDFEIEFKASFEDFNEKRTAEYRLAKLR